MRWDLVTRAECGVALKARQNFAKQNPKAAATGSHQNWHVRADRDLTVNAGLYKPWQAPIRAFFEAEMTSCKKHPSSKGCICEDVYIVLALDRLEGCFSHRLRVTKRINLRKKMGHYVEVGFHQPCAIVCVSQVY